MLVCVSVLVLRLFGEYGFFCGGGMECFDIAECERSDFL